MRGWASSHCARPGPRWRRQLLLRPTPGRLSEWRHLLPLSACGGPGRRGGTLRDMLGILRACLTTTTTLSPGRFSSSFSSFSSAFSRLACILCFSSFRSCLVRRAACVAALVTVRTQSGCLCLEQTFLRADTSCGPDYLLHGVHWHLYHCDTRFIALEVRASFRSTDM